MFQTVVTSVLEPVPIATEIRSLTIVRLIVMATEFQMTATCSQALQTATATVFQTNATLPSDLAWTAMGTKFPTVVILLVAPRIVMGTRFKTVVRSLRELLIAMEMAFQMPVKLPTHLRWTAMATMNWTLVMSLRDCLLTVMEIRSLTSANLLQGPRKTATPTEFQTHVSNPIWSIPPRRKSWAPQGT